MAAKPDLTRVWAAGAPGANVIDPDVSSPGKFNAGWLAEIPPFENFNFLQQLFSQGLANLNEEGIFRYDSVTDYPVDAYAKGSDGNIYRAFIANGPGTTVVDPVGDLTGTWIDPLKDIEIGAGQTWQNLTGSRSSGVTYTNTSGKSIQISVRCLVTTSAESATLTIGGQPMDFIGNTNIAGVQMALSAIVPDNTSYSVVLLGSASIIRWSELR
jgi:hypothetical protein